MPGQDSGEEERQRVGEENRQEAKKNYSIALIQEGKKKLVKIIVLQIQMKLPPSTFHLSIIGWYPDKFARLNGQM